MIKLLIIDDSKTERMIYRCTLEPLGIFEIIEQDDAESGFEALVQDKPDCVLMDNIMTRASGFQTIHKMMQEVRECPPIIFLTCALTEELRRNAIALGAKACFDKVKLDGVELIHTIIDEVAIWQKRKVEKSHD